MVPCYGEPQSKFQPRVTNLEEFQVLLEFQFVVEEDYYQDGPSATSSILKLSLLEIRSAVNHLSTLCSPKAPRAWRGGRPMVGIPWQATDVDNRDMQHFQVSLVSYMVHLIHLV